jgi:signal transduction histidine kinase
VHSVQRGIDFRVTLADGLPDEVQWDADRMNEVMGNLLANAFKFTGSGGTVELAVSPSDDHVQIVVRDTGAGIPPAQLPHIFEKFYQADNQGSASMPGTGLGLAIAKEIVEAHRGTIQCDSVVGEGTRFTLVLPTEGHLRRHTGQHRVAELEAVS